MLCTKPNCQEERARDKPWCLKHLAEYQRAYVTMGLDRENERGFVEGAQAMKAALLESLAPINPGGMWVVHEVKDWIAKQPAPARQTP